MSSFFESGTMTAPARAANGKASVRALDDIEDSSIEVIEVVRHGKRSQRFGPAARASNTASKRQHAISIGRCGGGGDNKPGSGKPGGTKPKPNEPEPRPKPPTTKPKPDHGVPGVS